MDRARHTERRRNLSSWLCCKRGVVAQSLEVSSALLMQQTRGGSWNRLGRLLPSEIPNRNSNVAAPLLNLRSCSRLTRLTKSHELVGFRNPESVLGQKSDLQPGDELAFVCVGIASVSPASLTLMSSKTGPSSSRQSTVPPAWHRQVPHAADADLTITTTVQLWIRVLDPCSNGTCVVLAKSQHNHSLAMQIHKGLIRMVSYRRPVIRPTFQ